MVGLTLRGVAQLGPGTLAEWRQGELRLSQYHAWEYRPDMGLETPAAAEDALDPNMPVNSDRKPRA